MSMQNYLEGGPTLAITIPTYNRAEVLNKNLGLILSQIGDLPVRVYVSDNCSTDHTRAVCLAWAATHPQLIYSCNRENIGFDRNILKLLDWAQGDYLWLLGDDDFPTEGAIIRLCELLACELPDGCVLNGINRGGLTQRCKNMLPGKIYHDINTFLSDLWVHQTWMSSIVMRRDLLVGFDGGRFKDSLFIHAQALNYALAQAQNFKLVYDAHSFLTYPNEDDIVNSYTPKALWLFIDRWSYNVDMLPDVVSPQTRLQCKKSTTFWAGTLFTLRGQGHYAYADYKKYRQRLQEYDLDRVAWLVAGLPPFFCRWLSGGIKRLREILR